MTVENWRVIPSGCSSALKIAVQEAKEAAGNSQCKGLQECEPRQTYFAKCRSPMRQGEFLSFAEDRIRPARAVAFAEPITSPAPHPALLRWRSCVVHGTRDCSTKSQRCLINNLHRRQEVREYILCVRCAGQICSSKGHL